MSKKELVAAAKMLRVLKDLPQAERLDVLSIVCAAFCQTGGAL